MSKICEWCHAYTSFHISHDISIYLMSFAFIKWHNQFLRCKFKTIKCFCCYFICLLYGSAIPSCSLFLFVIKLLQFLKFEPINFEVCEYTYFWSISLYLLKFVLDLQGEGFQNIFLFIIKINIYWIISII